MFDFLCTPLTILPVSVASGNIASQRDILIKLYLNSTMVQERLPVLATMLIKRERTGKLDLKIQ